MKKITARKELLLRKATEIAVAMEAADKDCKTIEEMKLLIRYPNQVSKIEQ